MALLRDARTTALLLRRHCTETLRSAPLLNFSNDAPGKPAPLNVRHVDVYHRARVIQKNGNRSHSETCHQPLTTLNQKEKERSNRPPKKDGGSLATEDENLQNHTNEKVKKKTFRRDGCNTTMKKKASLTYSRNRRHGAEFDYLRHVSLVLP